MRYDRASSREDLSICRRSLLTGGLASLALWSGIPRVEAGRRDPRLLVVLLRGGLDGLSLAAPVGDPAYKALRARIAIETEGAGAGLPLDDMFVLNPALPNLHALYRRGEALIVHAVATPYRGRSHFDGQDVLESGLPGLSRSDDGWLNRALSVLPSQGRADPAGLSIDAVVPLTIRGPAPILSWIPKAYNLPFRQATIGRLSQLYAATDPALAKAFADGLAAELTAGPGVTARGQPHRDFIETAAAAARFMSSATGPRVGVLSYSGWDTHANEGAVRGQLANRLAGLDAAIGSFQSGMGAAWSQTVVAVITEFGRTVRANGTDGTDHGTGMAAILAGGGIAGGRVVADWPGLADRALFEGRDLMPTRDLRAVLKGILHEHLGLPATALDTSVFPDSTAAKPERGLVRLG